MTTKVKQKSYVLDMFPYPSGASMHVGHLEGYVGTDILSRYLRMNGVSVLHPMGWDAFGLPAENYAIKTSVHPDKSTHENIKTFKRQLIASGLSYDWDYEIDTSSPDFYKWTQWLFIQMFKAGLAYKKKAPVNWCPKDETVLANEQVIDGRCERCDTPVVQKELEQWFLKITEYADRLIAGLDRLDWLNEVKTQQINWIGRREGARVEFAVSGPIGNIKVFTTRLDTIFGATFIVVSPSVANQWLDAGWKATNGVKEYIKKHLNNADNRENGSKEAKTGVDSGLKATNPINGEKITVWISDYVVGDVGTGAIMGVPAHDARDNEFARKFGLPVKTVIEPETGKAQPKEEPRRSIVAIVEDPKNKKYLTLNWGPKLGGILFIGGGREEGEDEVKASLREIKEETGYVNLEFIAKTEPTHHHYYAFSKKVARNVESIGLYFRLNGGEKAAKNLQHDEKGSFKVGWSSKEEILAKMEDENHLLCFRRLVLGEVYTGDGVLTGSGKYNGMRSEAARSKIIADLATHKLASGYTTYHLRDWLISRQRYWGCPIPMIYCRDCGWQPVDEKDLPVFLPTDIDFLPHGDSPLARSKSFQEGVVCLKCGKSAKREVDTMDTYVDSSWYFIRFVDPKNDKEFASVAQMKKWLPIDVYVGGGHVVQHLLFARFFWKVLSDIGLLPKSLGDEPFLKLRAPGWILGSDSRKMGKRWGNVVTPDEIIPKFGADTLRVYEMFMGPFEAMKPWSITGVEGIGRFLARVRKLYKSHANVVVSAEDAREVYVKMHQTIKGVTEDIENFRFNTAIAAMMEYVNLLYEKVKSQKTRVTSKIRCAEWDEALRTLCLLLAPFAPFMTEELLPGVHQQPWPKYREEFLKVEEVEVVVQVNGKLRGQLTVNREQSKSKTEIEKMAKEDPKVAKWLEGKKIRKTIFVSGKIINFVTNV